MCSKLTKLIKSSRKKVNLRNKIYTNLLSLGYSNEMILRNINNYDLFKEGRFIYESSIREKVSHKKRDELITIYDINLEYLKKIDSLKQILLQIKKPTL